MAVGVQRQVSETIIPESWNLLLRNWKFLIPLREGEFVFEPGYRRERWWICSSVGQRQSQFTVIFRRFSFVHIELDFPLMIQRNTFFWSVIQSISSFLSCVSILFGSTILYCIAMHPISLKKGGNFVFDKSNFKGCRIWWIIFYSLSFRRCKSLDSFGKISSRTS